MLLLGQHLLTKVVSVPAERMECMMWETPVPGREQRPRQGDLYIARTAICIDRRSAGRDPGSAALVAIAAPVPVTVTVTVRVIPIAIAGSGVEMGTGTVIVA